MSRIFHIVVCGGLVPDPLQTLEPLQGPSGWGIKNEAMLPAVLDPWAACSLWEAAALAKARPGSRVWLVCAAPKAKLQQVMMALAQKAPFELVPVDSPAGGFSDPAETAAALAEAISAVPGLEKDKLLLFGGWESASRGAGATLAMLAESLGITEQFQGVDRVAEAADGTLEVLERVEGGKHQASLLDGPPAAFGWATGSLPEPPNNPQTGMANMKALMPALQKAKAVKPTGGGLEFLSVSLPKQKRDTKVLKDWTVEQIAQDIVAWIKTN